MLRHQRNGHRDQALRQQTIDQHGVEDVDHLSTAIVGAGEPAPDRGRQHPVLVGCTIRSAEKGK